MVASCTVPHHPDGQHAGADKRQDRRQRAGRAPPRPQTPWLGAATADARADTDQQPSDEHRRSRHRCPDRRRQGATAPPGSGAGDKTGRLETASARRCRRGFLSAGHRRYRCRRCVLQPQEQRRAALPIRSPPTSGEIRREVHKVSPSESVPRERSVSARPGRKAGCATAFRLATTSKRAANIRRGVAAGKRRASSLPRDAARRHGHRQPGHDRGIDAGMPQIAAGTRHRTAW